MSTRTLTLEHIIDGTRTALTTCELASPASVTPAYGLRRQDTQAIAIATGSPFTVVSTGVYSKVLDSLVSGVTYEYYIHTVYLGVPKWHYRSFVAGATQASGLYADEDDLDDIRGSDAITVWSDLNNGNTRNHDRIQRGFDTTDAQIEQELCRRYLFPLTLSASDILIVRNWSSVLCAYWLYRNRGTRDRSSPTSPRLMNVYNPERDEVMEDIWLYANGRRSLSGPQASTTDVRVSAPSMLITRNRRLIVDDSPEFIFWP